MNEIGGVVSIWGRRRRERDGRGDASRFLSMQSLPCNIANSSSSRPCDHNTASTSPDTTYWCICFHEAKVLCIGEVKVYGVNVK
ncbi:hypothetical protein FIBSPDRAFT_861754 [Athelia psychrophila]|uniref:Uncharacterized protein n=1 Tax=Athelia psychrophila TaxID=1759441 RepID=A0A166J398_9AGAM|nr:hypothetical protein FIBSPDRAFT_861754 [Fibularhizoctonia sp. CBS 109695]